MELIAVVVIMAILAAVAVPAMTSTTETRAAFAANQVLRDLTYARQRALATGTRTWVVFDTNDDSWSILAEDPENPGRAGATAVVDPATGRPFVQNSGINMLIGVQLQAVDFDNDNEIGFDSMSRPFNAQEDPLVEPGTVTISGGPTIHVEPETGYVSFNN